MGHSAEEGQEEGKGWRGITEQHQKCHPKPREKPAALLCCFATRFCVCSRMPPACQKPLLDLPDTSLAEK